MSYYLSVVLCGRNDDYGRNYLKRLQTAIHGIDHFCAQHALACQVVFVEWNPPPDRPRIRSAVDWGSHIGVKIVTVPAHIDAKLPANRGRSGLHEFVAKNAGIRRADGHFILSCTSDLVFSPDLFHFLARQQLSADTLYRTTRFNVRALPDGVPPPHAPEWCRQNMLHADQIGKRSTIDSQALENLIHSNTHSPHIPDLAIRDMFSYEQDHEPLRIEAPLLRQFPHLIHVNAAGDFTLLSREGWTKLEGYLENDCRNHVDAWFCFHAVKRGFAQVILPMRMCVYHQEHESPPLQPYFETLTKLSKVSTNPNWGLADEPLEIEVLRTGRGISENPTSHN